MKHSWLRHILCILRGFHRFYWPLATWDRNGLVVLAQTRKTCEDCGYVGGE